MKEICGDLLSVERGLIVHGCNCSGGFGSGVAGAIARKYPEVKKYFHKVDANATYLGAIQPVKVSHELTIINAFTQISYGSDGGRYANLAAIQEVLYNTLTYAVLYDHPKIAVPRIGTGLGGLDWETEVKPIYETFSLACADKDVEFEVYFMEA